MSRHPFSVIWQCACPLNSVTAANQQVTRGVTAANQQVTREFWEDHRSRFELFVSLAVVDECMAGDSNAPAERDVFLHGIPVLDVTGEVLSLAGPLASGIPLPTKAAVDAVHIAAGAVHGLDYLVTWNCKHIANPAMRGTQAYRQSGDAWYN